MIKYLNDEKLETLIGDGITIVDFYADWCGPCKMLGSVLEQTNYDVVKINTDTHHELAQKFGVMSIPTVFIYKDGKECIKFIGFRSANEIEEMIKNL